MSKTRRTIRIQWTATAIECLRKLPPKVQRGLVAKADELALSGDPRHHKPLVGPLQGYHRITYARYRAVYTVTDEAIRGGEQITTIIVTFIAAGKREERSKDDIYQVAKKLVEMGAIQPPEIAPAGRSAAPGKGKAPGGRRRQPE